MRAVVIGAKRGLGLALTNSLLAAGHSVAAGVRDRVVPESLQALSVRYGERLLVGQAEITDEREVRSFADAVAARFGRADALCTVAGILLPGDRANTLLRCDIDEVRRTFDVNVVGPVIAAKCFYPVMEKGGKVLTVTSEGVGVHNAYPGSPAYALSKTAATKVSGILNATADDVDFYSVHPGRVVTDMNPNGEISAEESAEGILGILTGKIPVSREVWYIDYRGYPMEM